MNPKNPDLFKFYHLLPELSQQVVNLFVVKFSGVIKYDVLRYLQAKIDAKITQKEYQNILNVLVQKELAVMSATGYDVAFSMKIELFPKLIKEVRYIKLLKIIQQEHNPFNFIPTTEYIRDFLTGYFLEESRYSKDAHNRLISKALEAAPLISEMMQYPEYDQVFLESPVLLYEMLEHIQLLQVLYNEDFTGTSNFFDRNVGFEGLFDQVSIIKAEILFQSGKIWEADKLIDNLNNTASLLLKSQIELFKGHFELSVVCYEKAQITDKDGAKMSKKEFNLYYEFLYWLNFALNPKSANQKKIDVALNKKNRSKFSDDHFLLPLLYFLKKDLGQAESKFRQINTASCFTTNNFKSVFYLVLSYIIYGELNSGFQTLAQNTGFKLFGAKRWLLLKELNFIIEKSEYNMELFRVPKDVDLGTATSLMSRLTIPEKWEQLLDGLMNLTGVKVEGKKQDSASARVCYSVNMDKGYIKPILQTVNAKGEWTSGRNIALKRFKDQQVEGMTDQDRKVAASITYYSGYYGTNEYHMDFNKAIAELCGHPFLFLNSNPSVSVQLVRAQPEISTENGKFGIKLKTNIQTTDQRQILVKETQTRYKLIHLSTQQLAIIRMINQGITIPEKGKSKLIETVSGLSGVMTVHSDFAEENAEVKSIEADSRLRIQIVPIGDGLKAQPVVSAKESDPLPVSVFPEK
jgi:hypothetical protein